MLKLCNQFGQLQFSQLLRVYSSQSEQQLYAYLTDVFFCTKDAFIGIWQREGKYVSALRMEPYEDGLLLEALETAPEARNLGYATMLLSAVLEDLAKQGPSKVYSHVDKRNGASLSVHKACGFRILMDYAHYIDGSISQNAYTLCYEPQ